MNKRMIVAATFLVAAVLSDRVHADDTICSLGDAGTLHVQLPTGWTGLTDGQSPPTIRLKSADGKRATIQITTVAPANNNGKLKAAARQACKDFVEGAEEKKINLEEIKGDNVHGYLSSFTDAAADTGEPRFITAGALNSNDITLSITLLCVDKNGDDHAAALDTIKSLSITGDGATAVATLLAPVEQPTPAKELQVKSPDGTWALTVPGKWEVSGDDKPSDGKSVQVTATTDDGRSTMTIDLEPAAKADGDAKIARDYYFDRMQQNPLTMQNPQKGMIGDAATLEYDQGPDGFKQHNLNAYLSHAGVWVNVHFSKADFDEKTDRQSLDTLVKGLKME